LSTIVIIGGGIGGLASAMLLARDGHRVTLLERDPALPPAPAEAWDEWERRGVNQFRLPHGFMPRFTQVLEAELPDVCDALVDAGALRMNRLLALPDAVTGGYRPGDERFDAVTARRPFLEAVFAHAAAAEPGVEIRRGVAVDGLLAESRRDAPVHITGVVTNRGERIAADLVVDAGGRRSALPDLLTAVGAPPPSEWRAESGYVYFVRNYRSTDGSVPALLGAPVVHYDSVSVATLAGEGGTWSVILVASARDAVMRKARRVDVWERIARSYPLSAHWLDAEPEGGVDVIAKLEDRVRRLVVDGRPVATGVVAVADAMASTDPSLGRGASIGLVHAVGLRDVVRVVGTGRPFELASQWDLCTQREVMPMVDDALASSAHRLAQIDAQIAGVPYDPDDRGWTFAQSLAGAARSDPELLRALVEVAGLLARGVEVAARPGIAERIAAAPPATPPPGPDRAALLQLLRDEAA
jgi:2-polyprenyl-6-methoxyphenol hydroxylase-like FAD-dependent oxidoreductase